MLREVGCFEMLAMVRFPVGPFVKAWWWQQYIPDCGGLGRDYCLPVEAAIRFL